MFCSVELQKGGSARIAVPAVQALSLLGNMFHKEAARSQVRCAAGPPTVCRCLAGLPILPHRVRKGKQKLLQNEAAKIWRGLSLGLFI